jgi:hypothetical protein
VGRRLWFASAFVVVVSALPAWAQDGGDTLSALETAVACALPPQKGPANTELRLVGAQDTVVRSAYAGRDMVIIGSGSHGGVQVGMRYYVRRSGSHGEGRYTMFGPHAVQTAGWIRVVTVNEDTALAVIEHACSALNTGDYLEPFVAPALPADADKVDTSGRLDFSSPARVLYGDLERRTGSVGDFMLMDRGAGDGATAGARYAIFRDLHSDHLPLASIGEAIVVAEGDDVSLVRIVHARDAVFSGDYLVPRK